MGRQAWRPASAQAWPWTPGATVRTLGTGASVRSGAALAAPLYRDPLQLGEDPAGLDMDESREMLLGSADGRPWSVHDGRGGSSRQGYPAVGAEVAALGGIAMPLGRGDERSSRASEGVATLGPASGSLTFAASRGSSADLVEAAPLYSDLDSKAGPSARQIAYEDDIEAERQQELLDWSDYDGVPPSRQDLAGLCSCHSRGHEAPQSPYDAHSRPLSWRKAWREARHRGGEEPEGPPPRLESVLDHDAPLTRASLLGGSPRRDSSRPAVQSAAAAASASAAAAVAAAAGAAAASRRQWQPSTAGFTADFQSPPEAPLGTPAASSAEGPPLAAAGFLGADMSGCGAAKLSPPWGTAPMVDAADPPYSPRSPRRRPHDAGPSLALPTLLVCSPAHSRGPPTPASEQIWREASPQIDRGRPAVERKRVRSCGAGTAVSRWRTAVDAPTPAQAAETSTLSPQWLRHPRDAVWVQGQPLFDADIMPPPLGEPWDDPAIAPPESTADTLPGALLAEVATLRRENVALRRKLTEFCGAPPRRYEQQPAPGPWTADTAGAAAPYARPDAGIHAGLRRGIGSNATEVSRRMSRSQSCGGHPIPTMGPSVGGEGSCTGRTGCVACAHSRSPSGDPRLEARGGADRGGRPRSSDERRMRSAWGPSVDSTWGHVGSAAQPPRLQGPPAGPSGPRRRGGGPQGSGSVARGRAGSHVRRAASRE